MNVFRAISRAFKLITFASYVHLMSIQTKRSLSSTSIDYKKYNTGSHRIARISLAHIPWRASSKISIALIFKKVLNSI